MNTGSFVKGMVTGAIVGMGISMVANPIDGRDKKKLVRRTSRMFTTIGTIADNVLDAIK